MKELGQQNPEANPEVQLITRPVIAIADLFGGIVPEQQEYESLGVEEFYHGLAAEQALRVFVEHRKKGTIYTIGSQALTGVELQHLFHYGAPSKYNGLDFEDRHGDWNDLYDPQDPEMVKLLLAHRRIPKWDIFENHREFLDNFIHESQMHYLEDTYVVPMIRIGEKDGKVKWDFTDLDRDEADTMDHIYRSDGFEDPSVYHFIPALGPTLAAAYSPDVTNTWETDLNMRLKPQGRTQDMGSTQSLTLSLAKAPDLFNGAFMQNLLSYARTGNLPPRVSSADRHLIDIPPINTAADADTEPLPKSELQGVIFYPENPLLSKKKS